MIIGKSVCGRDITVNKVGCGEAKLLIAGGFHANEWITSAALRTFYEHYCYALETNGEIQGVKAKKINRLAALHIIPEVNPDGVALLKGQVTQSEHAAAEKIAAGYPDIPFPDGWKANIRGVDLNLNFPAGWDTAKRIKAELGFYSPAPRDYPGSASLSEPESAALYEYTQKICPDMILAFHSQGRVIYWKYLDIDVPHAWDIACNMAKAGGYEAEETPYASGHAGYKDWFIKEYRKPGFTIEVGEGENPLPTGDFPQILEESERIIISAVFSLINPR